MEKLEWYDKRYEKELLFTQLVLWHFSVINRVLTTVLQNRIACMRFYVIQYSVLFV